MKTGKATGPDMISTEMMQALEGIELDATTKMLTQYMTLEKYQKKCYSQFSLSYQKKKKKKKKNKERQSVNNIVQ